MSLEQARNSQGFLVHVSCMVDCLFFFILSHHPPTHPPCPLTEHAQLSQWFHQLFSVLPSPLAGCLSPIFSAFCAVGYRSKANDFSFNGVNPKMLEDQVTRKVDMYHETLKQTHRLCEKKRVGPPTTFFLSLHFATAVRIALVHFIYSDPGSLNCV